MPLLYACAAEITIGDAPAVDAQDFALDHRTEVSVGIGADDLTPLQLLLHDGVGSTLRSGTTCIDLERALESLRLDERVVRHFGAISEMAATGVLNRGRTRVIFPRLVVTAFEQIAALHLASAARLSSQLAQDDRRAALPWLRLAFEHSPAHVGFRKDVLQVASRTLIGVHRYCDGVELLRTFVAMHGGDLELALRELNDPSREQFAVLSMGCGVNDTLAVFEAMLSLGYLNPRAPTKRCAAMLCWGMYDMCLRKHGQHARADRFFLERLAPYVPWVHPTQLPTSYDRLIATAEPQPFLDPQQQRVAQLVLGAREMIRREYLVYEQAVLAGTARNGFDKTHSDAYLSAEDGGGWWEYLVLKHGSWTWLCEAHFRETCDLLRGLPEVDGEVDPRVGRCQGYCALPHVAHEGPPGMTTFYRLAPNRTLSEHIGPSNARLKCHFVLRAPEKGPHGASITVGGVTRDVGRDDTFCFDDSYEHSVRNGGGVHQNEDRVVFDVSYWHPSLHHALRLNTAALPPPTGDMSGNARSFRPDLRTVKTAKETSMTPDSGSASAEW